MKLFSFKTRTPRWIVLLSDLSISGLSLLFAYLIRFDLKTDQITIEQEWNQLSGSILLFFSIRACVFFFFQIHQGLLRHTSTQDLKRIVLAVSSTSILFFLFGLVRLYYFYGFYLFPMSVLIIEYLACLMLLLASRFTIKLLYLEHKRERGSKENVLIYGAGVSGVITKRTIEKDTKNASILLGFIDDNEKLIGNRIEGLKVFSFDHVKKNHSKLKVKKIILAIQQLEKSKKASIVEFCIQNNISVLKVPNASSWINNSFNSNQFTNINIEELLGRDSIQLNSSIVQKEIQPSTVLVTGAAGSIGSGLCVQIASFHPKKIILLDQAESPLHDLHLSLKDQYPTIDFELVIGDICNMERMQKLFSHFRIDIVYHAAAYKHVPMMELNPAESVLNNVFGTKIISELSVEHSVKKFVFISTDKAVNPTNVMGATKRTAELLVQYLNKNSSTTFIVTRFGNVLGSNGSVIPLFKKQIEQGGPVTLTDEKITRYFMTIPEACQLVLEAGAMGKGGEIYVFDMGKPVKVLDLAKKMISLANLTLGEDIQIVVTGLRPGEKLYEELLANDENTLPTHNKKILIANTTASNKGTFDKISALTSIIHTQDNDKIVRALKEIVPEFKSNNSEFSKFDQ